MRGINAKSTGQNADPSRRIAKRAVLLAVLVATGSSAGAQQPRGAMIQSRYFNQTAGTPQLVRQGAESASGMSVGVVQSNPFFASDQPASAANSSDPRVVTDRVDMPSDLAGRPVGRVRQNPNFQPSGVSDQPLIALDSIDAHATQVEAFDRFSQEAAGVSNAPQNQTQPPSQSARGSLAVAAPSTSPAPLAIPTGAATPISSAPIGSAPAAMAAEPTRWASRGQAVPIGVAAEQSSRVIPVTDARDHQTTIQETQPIFFTLSDDTAEDDDAFTSDFQAPAEAAEADPVDPSPADDAGEAPSASHSTASAASEPIAQGPISDTAKPDAPESEDASSPPSAPPASKPDSAPVAIGTPVKLAPAVNFLPEALAPIDAGNAQPSADEIEAVSEADRNSDDEIDALVVSNRARARLLKVPSQQQAQPVLQKVQPAPQPLPQPTATAEQSTQDPVSQIAVNRHPKAVAIATPPVDLQFSDHDAAVVQSAIDPIRFNEAAKTDPAEQDQQWPTTNAQSNSAAMSGDVQQDTLVVKAPATAGGQPHGPSDVRSAEPDTHDAMPAISRRQPVATRTVLGKTDAERTQRQATTGRVGSHAIVTSEAPGIEQIGTDEAPLIAAPVAVNPSQAASRAAAEKGRPSIARADSGLPARLASSRSNLRRQSIDPEQKRIDVTVPDPRASQTHGGPGSPSGDQHQAVVLQLRRAQVRSMTIGGRVRRFTIEDKDVCQAFASGANQIKLIGTGTGQTQMTIWADVVDGQPTRKQTFQIQVSEGVDAIGEKVAAHTELLNDSIDKAFPTASVVVSLRGGELVVAGRCDDEETAKQIVRMVRKSCLVPVQDNLKVR
ncbi:hypothetical protein Mal15_16300 [Stieleria maiorica]|uniref:Pilus formation protein N-terminal domain-containing protein n=1 Tax=Stieleria maiorica TaxID=2795974 RepID=A0A5B9MAP0_9BACT|nr:pilus assembly protein N-terminal domain-containing protein [Stieleria maiorica]QEF97589.1 hypothetical protein Mal15_16300 [Stieleria maiorica]